MTQPYRNTRLGLKTTQPQVTRPKNPLFRANSPPQNGARHVQHTPRAQSNETKNAFDLVQNSHLWRTLRPPKGGAAGRPVPPNPYLFSTANLTLALLPAGRRS